MRSLGLVCAGLLALAACAEDPELRHRHGGKRRQAPATRRRRGRQRRQLHAAGAEAVAPEPDHLARRAGVLDARERRGGRQRHVPQRRLERRQRRPRRRPRGSRSSSTAGPTRILVSWDDGGTYNYKDPAGTTVYGLPGRLPLRGVGGFDQRHRRHLDDGGRRRSPATTSARARTRSTSPARRWIKMVITAAPAERERATASRSARSTCTTSRRPATGLPDDTWFFMGDSITAFAYDRDAATSPASRR